MQNRPTAEMYRLNVSNNQSSTGVNHTHPQIIGQTHHHQQQQQQLQQHQQILQHQSVLSVNNQGDVMTVGGGTVCPTIMTGGNTDNSVLLLNDESILAAVKAEPLHESASTSATLSHVIYAPIKRPRLEG